MDDQQPVPVIDLNPIGHILCAKHGEPFRKEWPKGIAQILILGMDFIAGKMETEPPAALEQYLSELKQHEGRGIDTPKAIPLILAARQVCCRVTEDRLLEMYKAADIGKWAICEACGTGAFGFFYRVNMHPPWKRKPHIKEFDHLCFKCIQRAGSLPQGR